MTAEQLDIGEDRTLLLVDDDEPFLRRLAKAMEKRGFEVDIADSVAAGRESAMARPPSYAFFNLRLGVGNGLVVFLTIRVRRPVARILVLTVYGAFATAFPAVK